MQTIGITGGIGSGKSTVSNFFRLLGAPVFNADTEAKAVMNHSVKIKMSLSGMFGSDIYLPNRELDRKKLAKLVFENPSLLEKLNQIVHPEVRNWFFDWKRKQNAPYIVYEAAILFESGFYKQIDYSILVVAPTEERILRVMKRNNATRSEVEARIKNQWTDEEKMKHCNYIINNDNSELIIPQIIAFDNQFKRNG